MRPARIAAAVLLAAAVAATGCTARSAVHPPAAAPATTVAPDVAPPADGGDGPVMPVRPSAWPTGPRQGPGSRGAGVLRAVRTARQATFDRVVFEFDRQAAPTAYRVRYVPQVTRDPSGQPVVLRGRSFLEVILEGATTADANGRPVHRGPASLTPALPALQQVSIAGDFERVLTFGLGVDHRAGFRVLALASPARIVIDVAHGSTAPFPGIWDVSTWDQAFSLQAALDEGHQPWRCSASGLVTRYARQVLLPGSPQPTVRQVGPRAFQVLDASSALVATVRLAQPVNQGSCGLWVITRVDRTR
jgi:hypothetical protein